MNWLKCVLMAATVMMVEKKNSSHAHSVAIRTVACSNLLEWATKGRFGCDIAAVLSSVEEVNL